MTEIQKIQSWKAPVWHQDWHIFFGDPEAMLSLLKKVCLNMLELSSSYSFELELPEEGYMNVCVSKDGQLFGELSILDFKKKTKIGFFPEEGGEIYIEGTLEVRKIHEMRLEDLTRQSGKESVLSLGEGGVKSVQEIISEAVEKGNGFQGTFAGESVIFFEDGNLVYVIRESGEFWTILDAEPLFRHADRFISRK